MVMTQVSGCFQFGTPHTAEDVARSRAEVRTAAAQDLPALAEALGATIVAARGEYNSSDDRAASRRQYQAIIELDGPVTTAGQVTRAFEALGYEITQEPEPESPDAPVIGERDGLEIGMDVGEPRGWVSLAGPTFTIPTEDPPVPAEESLDLPGLADLPLSVRDATPEP